MTTPRTRHTVAIAAVCVLALAAPALAQQDALARAKALYASASYEDALQVLATSTIAPSDTREVAAYQFFCLVALGRTDEAKHAIETIVKVDPLYHPSEEVVSPRVLALFEDTRRPLLPTVVKDEYEQAKSAFEKKDMPAASSQFDSVIKLLDEMGPSQGADMRTLAAGFRELAKAAIPPPPPPPVVTPPAADPGRIDVGSTSAPTSAPAPAPAKPAAPAANPATVYGRENLDVVRPIPVGRTMPEFMPANKFEATQTFRGTLELVIDERGKVISAAILKSIQSAYDPLLLKAAQGWTFKPATRQGAPVKYAYRMDIQVGRAPIGIRAF